MTLKALSFIFVPLLVVLVCRVESKIDEPIFALSEDDFENGSKLSKDIRGPVASAKRHRRNGVSRPTKLWPSAVIPYAISPHYSSHERALLARAVKQYHEKSCIRFVPRTPGQSDYLFIGKVDGCFSEVGRTSGVQVLSLDNGCMEYPTIIHEMMHVIGFYHEHERWDRDSFIDIIWQNIDRAALDQFGKVDLSKTSYYGQDYDYKSILHYDSLAFSKNGLPTMLPKKAGMANTIGNAKDFSDVDLKKINRMYKCRDYLALEEGYQGDKFMAQQPLAHARALAGPVYNAYNVPIQPTFTYTSNPYGETTNDNHNQWHFNGNAPNAQNPHNLFGNAMTEYQSKDGYGSPNHISNNKDTPSEGVCRDKITVCWWTKSRCRAISVKAMMKSLCARTCGYCN
uniref:Metalloendopeptidase n=1 Tax=Rhabditophanes sp. KR3021 TaxID=114890 RepID=A0AC35U8H1_9BILA